jgi:hypothetical protein
MTTAQRGYGYEHRKLRESWRPRVEAGQVACSLCGLMIEPGQEFDLAHDPMDSRRYLGPAHARARHCLTGGNRNTALEKRLHGRRRKGFHWRSELW